MLASESISLEVDGAPVVFELARWAGMATSQLLADGVAIDSPARGSLSHYGRNDLVDLFREAVRSGKMAGASQLADSALVMISSVRGYLHLPDQPRGGMDRIMIYRTNDVWACAACQTVDCEHVGEFLRKRALLNE